MKNDINCLRSEDIEIDCSPLFKEKLNSTFWNSLYSIWEKFVKILLADPHELKVWRKVDRHGNIYWQAYDPATGKSFFSGSEADVCMWIEQLYRY